MHSISKIVNLLKKRYKEREVVDFGSPYKVLVATILSQRTKDEITEKVANALFSRFKNIKEIANSDLSLLEKVIKSSGFYKAKARNIKALSLKIIKDYKRKVPKDMKSLLSLPGVGRKTANCVLVYAYRIPAIPVDIHVHRISNRIGLVKSKSSEQAEEELVKSVPKKYWIDFNRIMVKHGKAVCLSRKPKCFNCVIAKYCGYKYKNLRINKK